MTNNISSSSSNNSLGAYTPPKTSLCYNMREKLLSGLMFQSSDGFFRAMLKVNAIFILSLLTLGILPYHLAKYRNALIHNNIAPLSQTENTLQQGKSITTQVIQRQQIFPHSVAATEKGLRERLNKTERELATAKESIAALTLANEESKKGGKPLSGKGEDEPATDKQLAALHNNLKALIQDEKRFRTAYAALEAYLQQDPNFLPPATPPPLKQDTPHIAPPPASNRNALLEEIRKGTKLVAVPTEIFLDPNTPLSKKDCKKLSKSVEEKNKERNGSLVNILTQAITNIRCQVNGSPNSLDNSDSDSWSADSPVDHNTSTNVKVFSHLQPSYKPTKPSPLNNDSPFANRKPPETPYKEPKKNLNKAPDNNLTNSIANKIKKYNKISASPIQKLHPSLHQVEEKKNPPKRQENF